MPAIRSPGHSASAAGHSASSPGHSASSPGRPASSPGRPAIGRLRWLAATLAIVALLTIVALPLVAASLQTSVNLVFQPPPYETSAAAARLHASLRVADLHADALLWNGDLTVRSEVGHVDIPRLIEGNVALQAFTVVTKTPAAMNIDSNSGDSDQITLLAIAQRWPIPTWFSLTERARYQAEKLDRFAANSQGRLTLIRDRADLEAYLRRRAGEPGITAGFLGLEGAHALEGRIENVEVLFRSGFRMLGLTHFFDNAVGGSAHGVDKGGLTDFGRAVLGRAEDLGMLVDLAHASPALIDDVLTSATRPIVVSHTGVRGTCDNQRNLSDAQLHRIAANGGVVGIGFWPTAVCGRDAGAIARGIRYAVDRIGADHVALGSDFDGAIGAPFDASGIALVTEALLDKEFSEDQIAAIMGGNVIRLLQQVLP